MHHISFRKIHHYGSGLTHGHVDEGCIFNAIMSVGINQFIRKIENRSYAFDTFKIYDLDPMYTGCPIKNDTLALSHYFRINYLIPKFEADI